MFDFIELFAYCCIAASFGGGWYLAWHLISRAYHLDEIFAKRNCRHDYTRCWKCGHRKEK